MFPQTHWRDLDKFSKQGLNYSTSSNEAVKLFDALIHQIVFHYNDEELGGYLGTVEKMFQADQDFAMGQIFSLTGEMLGTNPNKGGRKPREKLTEFVADVTSGKRILTELEKRHMKAAQLISKEDLIGAMYEYESTLKDFPLDILALHMGFLLALVSGQTRHLHSFPNMVINRYRPSDNFYGHVYGKLAFGECELGQYEAALENGLKALDCFSRDNWAHHAVAHIYEETGKAREGTDFLLKREEDWKQGTSFAHHLWWHQALMAVSLEDYDSALQLYDTYLEPNKLLEKDMFSLSDGSALLMRLQLQGVNIGDRARSLGTAWQEFSGDCTSLFYDGHSMFTSLLSGKNDNADRLINSLRDYITDETREGHNKELSAKFGVNMLLGIQQYFEGNFSECVQTLYPIMGDMMACLGGSKAQRNVFRLILLYAALKSGSSKDLQIATEVLQEKLTASGLSCYVPIDQRIENEILKKH